MRLCRALEASVAELAMPDARFSFSFESLAGSRWGDAGPAAGELLYSPAPAAAPRAAAASDGFAKGDHVAHKTFGPGVVIGVSGDTIEVKFTRTGKTKKLLKGFAPIVKVS